ncbi:M57 family metalloprotease [Sphingobacterium thalpophilum]|uniref:M57 family metalloprotease n=1 Tax=Sphingobacterium thalpophilum TaxID=259 RepID=A0ACD5C522_9SPHI
MKKINSILLLCVGAMFIAGCSKEDSRVKSSSEIAKKDTAQLVLDGLKALGFQTEGLITRGDTLIVEGDILMFKSKLLDSKATKARQATTSNFPYIRNANMNLRVYIQDATSSTIPTGFSYAEREIIKSALNLYLSSNLTSGGFNSITYTTNPNEGVHIRIIQGNMDEYTCGYAQFPTTVYENGSAYQNISGFMNIHLSIFRFQLNDSQKTFLIAHEFGHMMGFRHTNWRRSEAESSDGVGAYTVPLTNNNSTNPDPSSVFNGGTCTYHWNGFSNGDLQAIKYVTRGTTSS